VEQQSAVRPQSRFRTLYYWAALLIALLLIDDVAFSWIFWGLSQYNPWISAAAALAIWWSMGYWITLRGLRHNPGRVAAWFLKSLQLERKNEQLRERQMYLRSRVRSVATAVPLTLLLGGVVTTLWLRRNNVIDDHRARRLALWLCGLYALEYAAVHAIGIGGSIFWARQ